MPSRRLFVIRVGDPNGLWATWNPQNKWSTPEVPNGPSAQLVRNAWVEGHEVHILFLGTGDVPLHYGLICGVRPRNPQTDAAFPTRTDAGELQCFMLFENLIRLRNHHRELFQGILDEIQYTRGTQIPISQANAGGAFTFYQGIVAGQQAGPRGAPNNEVVVNNPAVNANINATYQNMPLNI